VFEQFADSPTELVVALGREGKQQFHFDPAGKPRTAAMAAKAAKRARESRLPQTQCAV
jgi:hypothetical protein